MRPLFIAIPNFSNLKKKCIIDRETDQPTDRPTNWWIDLLIEMCETSKKDKIDKIQEIAKIDGKNEID